MGRLETGETEKVSLYRKNHGTITSHGGGIWDGLTMQKQVGQSHQIPH